MGARVIASLILLGSASLVISTSDNFKRPQKLFPHQYHPGGLVYLRQGAHLNRGPNSASPSKLSIPPTDNEPISRRYHYEADDSNLGNYITYLGDQYQDDTEENLSGGDGIDVNAFLGDLDGFSHYKSSHSFNLEGPRQVETIDTNSYHKEVEPYDATGFSEQQSDHKAEEEHAEVHYHQHKHVHKHNHKQSHMHKHKNDHKHEHGHKHESTGHHEHKHQGDHKHEHMGKHEHHHTSKHEHKHHGSHQHKHHGDHKHEHKQKSEHKHHHKGEHKHEHHSDHKHEHKGEHKHHHHHDHKHHSDHHHKHSEHGHHKHGHHHGHKHSHHKHH